jgi:hypothetical protein
MGGGWLTPRLGRCAPGKQSRCPLYRRLGGPHGRYGRMRKTSPPPGFDPRTVQPVASHYTGWNNPAHEEQWRYINLLGNRISYLFVTFKHFLNHTRPTAAYRMEFLHEVRTFKCRNENRNQDFLNKERHSGCKWLRNNPRPPTVKLSHLPKARHRSRHRDVNHVTLTKKLTTVQGEFAGATNKGRNY